MSNGWHVLCSTIFVPTGRYTDGASNNTGFGMWGHELAVGTTVYLNAARQWHAATLATFDFQSKKEDSETKVGNAMNLEGGLGGDFLKGGLTVGLNYFASFKLTDDHIEGFPDILIRGKNKDFGLGPEVQLALARKNTLYGFLKVNYQWEVYTRTATQGSEMTILATFLMKPLKLAEPVGPLLAVDDLALHRVEVLVELLDAGEDGHEIDGVDDVEHFLHLRPRIDQDGLPAPCGHELPGAEDSSAGRRC